MARWHPSQCKVCDTRVPPISARGLCVDCAIERQTKTARQLAAGEGPDYETWRKAMIAVGKRARLG